MRKEGSTLDKTTTGHSRDPSKELVHRVAMQVTRLHRVIPEVG